jgi:hypothetical protein
MTRHTDVSSEVVSARPVQQMACSRYRRGSRDTQFFLRHRARPVLDFKWERPLNGRGSERRDRSARRRDGSVRQCENHRHSQTAGSKM